MYVLFMRHLLFSEEVIINVIVTLACPFWYFHSWLVWFYCSWSAFMNPSNLLWMQIWNKNFFTPLDYVCFTWSLSADGSVLETGTLQLPPLAPTAKHTMKLESGSWASKWKNSIGREIFLDIVAYLSAPSRWADAGHILASQQILLPVFKPSEPEVCTFKSN